MYHTAQNIEKVVDIHQVVFTDLTIAKRLLHEWNIPTFKIKNQNTRPSPNINLKQFYVFTYLFLTLPNEKILV